MAGRMAWFPGPREAALIVTAVAVDGSVQVHDVRCSSCLKEAVHVLRDVGH